MVYSMPTDMPTVCLRIIVYGMYTDMPTAMYTAMYTDMYTVLYIIIIFSSSLYSSKLEKIEIISYHTTTSIQTTNNYYKYFRNATTTTIRQWNALFASTLSTPLTTALLLIADIHFIVSVL